MKSGIDLCRAVVLRWLAITAVIAVLVAATDTLAAAPADQSSHASCIAVVTPSVEGMPGSTADAANAVRDLMVSYLQGPSTKVLVLEAKLPSVAAEEAKQRSCEPLLILGVHRKSGGSHSFIKVLSQAAASASWSLPYGSSTAAGVARTGTAAGLQTVSSLAQSTKARDELSLEYQLQSADGQIQFGPRTERRTAKADGEDLLTPVVAHAAEAIVAQSAATPAASSRPPRPQAGHNEAEGAVQYLDHLKACAPYTFNYSHPLVVGFTGQNIIQGKKGDKCQVTYLMPNNLRTDCEHGQATIERMTSDDAYKQARAGELNFSLSSENEDPLVKQECRLFQESKELPVGGH